MGDLALDKPKACEVKFDSYNVVFICLSTVITLLFLGNLEQYIPLFSDRLKPFPVIIYVICVRLPMPPR